MNSLYSCRFEMERTDLFLSHNWGMDDSGRDNHQRVSLIGKKLIEMGYKTWFDEDKMAGDLDKKIAQGIDQTKGMIAFLTRKYCEKVNGNNSRDNCKIEFMYASRKKLVAVVMEKQMCNSNTWMGLIGLTLGGQLFVDMSGDLEDNLYLSRQMELLKIQLQSKGIHPEQGIFCSYFSFKFFDRKNYIF